MKVIRRKSKQLKRLTVSDFNIIESDPQPQLVLRVLNEVVTTRRLSAIKLYICIYFIPQQTPPSFIRSL